MKAIDFVKNKFPNAVSFPMIDNYRGRTSYVIIKGLGSLEIFPNEGAKTASQAWTNAKKYLQKLEFPLSTIADELKKM